MESEKIILVTAGPLDRRARVFGQHSLMQDARNENASMLLTVKDDVLAVLLMMQSRTHIITEST
jgi:hypothetical protein